MTRKHKVGVECGWGVRWYVIWHGRWVCQLGVSILDVLDVFRFLTPFLKMFQICLNIF